MKLIETLKIGQSFTLTKKITKEDVETYGKIIGDLNPVHYDEEYAKKTIFKKRVAHGMLIGSLFSPILGMNLPGEGTIYLKQDLKFLKPVYIDDEIISSVEIIEIKNEKNIIILETIAKNQKNEVVIEGFATVMPPKEKKNV